MQTHTCPWIHANITQTQSETHAYRYKGTYRSQCHSFSCSVVYSLIHPSIKRNQVRFFFGLPLLYRISNLTAANCYLFGQDSGMGGSLKSLWKPLVLTVSVFPHKSSNPVALTHSNISTDPVSSSTKRPTELTS